MYKNLLAVCINFFAFTSNAKAQTVYYIFQPACDECHIQEK